MRENLYPLWQARGQLTPALAARRLALQRAIVATLARLVEAEAEYLGLLGEAP